jgi:methylmalonyl-CoA mutase cobalamin-binding subunit
VFRGRYDEQAMYNIKQAAARAGVSVPVLRAWERRYGIVNPERSASGYRRFDDESVARIRTMRGLVEDGWSPSAAAAAILAGEVPVRADGPSGGPAAAGTAASGSAAGIPDASVIAADLGERLVAAARDLDPVGAEDALDELFSRGSFERVAADLLFPVLERLGIAWAAGEVSIAGEHMASAAAHRRLAIALEAAGPPANGTPRIVVGLPPGARHELGALAFAVAARRAGLGVVYVGADLPVADWVGAASGADAVVIGVVTGRDRRPALEVARAIRDAQPDAVVAFGGDAAPAEPGTITLPESLREAVARLSEVLTEPRRATLAGD